MQVHKNELIIYRGEAFTLDDSVQYSDGTPYIISNRLDNPYFLLSISNSAFSQNQREVRNYWINLNNIKKFTSTTPINIQDFKNASENGESVYSEFSDIESFPISGVYLNGELIEEMTDEHAVFYNSLEPGQYKYWSDGRWYDYDCRITCPFTSNDTKTWQAQKYYYTIQLVSGIELRNYLVSIYEELISDGASVDMTNSELYEILKDKFTFPKDFNITQPIAIVSSSVPLLSPTSITVISYMQGDITW